MALKAYDIVCLDSIMLYTPPDYSMCVTCYTIHSYNVPGMEHLILHSNILHT